MTGSCPWMPRLVPRSPRIVSLSVAAACFACGSSNAGPSEAARTPPTARPNTENAASPDPAESTIGPQRTHSDFLQMLDEAELFDRSGRILDLGAVAGAQYTLGGWQTNLRVGRTVDGTLAATGAADARLLVPWHRSGAARLDLRVRRLGTGPVSWTFNDHDLPEPQIPPDGDFHTVSLTLRPPALRTGENHLRIRSRRSSSGQLAVEWGRISRPESAAASGLPVPRQPRMPQQGPGILLPNGLRIGWSLEIPAQARLQVRAQGPSPVLRISVVDDTLARTVLGHAKGTQEVDLSLDRYAGQIVRIDFESLRSDVHLARTRVTVPQTVHAPPPPAPKNVVVFLIDTLRADKLRPYNPESRVETPGLAQFANGAATFVSAHAPENWTKPSVASLLSSLLPWQHTAVKGESVVPRSVRLLPEMLQVHGFHTGAFIANGYVSDRFGFQKGWNTYRNYIREGRRTPAQYVAADVLQWLDKRPADKPFFLYVHTIDPHVPYRPPPDFLARYAPDPYHGPVSFRRDATLLEKIKLGRLRLRPPDKLHLEALYDGEITYHDVHFNAILRALEERDLAQDTLVIVTSDHGEEFWDHGSVGHGHNVYEELLRVPFFVRLPGAPSNLHRIKEPVSLVDVVPTIFEALHLPIPESAEGRSLLPLLTGQDEQISRVVVSGFMEAWRTAVSGRYKLIHRTKDRFMLFDLHEDPGEQHDRATEQPITVRHLRGRLGLALARTDPAANRTKAGPRRRRRRPARHRAQDTEIDPETKAQLRALGYVVD